MEKDLKCEIKSWYYYTRGKEGRILRKGSYKLALYIKLLSIRLRTQVWTPNTCINTAEQSISTTSEFGEAQTRDQWITSSLDSHATLVPARGASALDQFLYSLKKQFLVLGSPFIWKYLSSLSMPSHTLCSHLDVSQWTSGCQRLSLPETTAGKHESPSTTKSRVLLCWPQELPGNFMS